jgi:sulfate adenylyltransferase subunit 2
MNDATLTNTHAAHSYLDQLEAESIHIFRETVAECDKSVMLYSWQ